MKWSSEQQIFALAQTLPTQLALTLVGVALVATLLSWFPEMWLIQAQLEQQAWSQVDQGRRITRSLYRHQTLETNNLASYISQLPELRRVLNESASREEIGRQLYLHLNLLTNQADFDLLVVCDAYGEPLVQLGSFYLPQICELEPVNGVQVIPTAPVRQAWWLTTQPIGDQTGLLVVGKVLNDEFAVQLHLQTGLEHTILVDDQPVATSLTRLAPVAAPTLRNLLPAPHLNHQEGETKITFHWDGVPYYASQAVLFSPGLVDEVALDVTTLSQVKQRITRSQIISVVIVGLTGILVALLLAHHIRRALAKLAQAALQFSKGDLESPVVISEGVHEITQVAQSLEQARQDLRHMLVALRQEKAWGEHLLQAIVEGIVTLDDGGYITFWSKGAERITGWSREQVLLRHCNAVFASGLGQPKLSEIAATANKHQPLTLVVNDGSPITLDVVSMPFIWQNSDGKTQPARANRVVMFRDISEEVAVQHLLGHFMANMTHEFRTPLSALAAGIELLQDQAPDLSPMELQELLGSLYLGVLSLQTLVDNLLESTRLESGVFATYPHPTDLGELVDEAAQTMHPLLAKYGQRLQINLPAPVPLVHADPRRTIQVLVNLIANSGKYGPAEAEIDIGATIAHDQVRITIADRGAGVPVHQREKIFSRFIHFETHQTNVLGHSEHQIPQEGRSKQEAYTGSRAGTGLGLWIVKNIVEAQGGRVGVEGRTGGGAVFWFTLKIAEEA